MKGSLILDKRPTMAEWPVQIWDVSELPEDFEEKALAMLKDRFEEYYLVYAPIRRTAQDSFAYLFGYGRDEIFYLRKYRDKVEQKVLKRGQIVQILTQRELLNAKITVYYKEMQSSEEKMTVLEFPYVPSVYYLYDPFLNWMLGIDRDFTPALAEHEHPRPDKLYRESPVMFNYSLGAYRLGDSFEEYSYRSKQHRHKWMPWRKMLEEWLEIPMSRGVFRLHSMEYLTECTYSIE